MNKIVLDKVKSTMYKFDVEIDEDILLKIINDIKPIYKNYFLSKLPTLKEIDSDLSNQDEINSYVTGIADGAKKIIKQFNNL